MSDEPGRPELYGDENVAGGTQPSDANQPHVVTIPNRFARDRIPQVIANTESCPTGCTVHFDLRGQTFVTPTLMAFLCVYGDRLQSGGTPVCVLVDQQLQERECFHYLQRMDFFRIGGIEELDIVGPPHLAADGAVPLREITSRDWPDGMTERLSTELADAVLDFGDLAKSCLRFCFGELVNNVVQHSLANGFACAQYYRNADQVRLTIADSGIGIRRSLQGNPQYAQLANDGDALLLAIKPAVTGNPPTAAPYDQPANSGLGLFMLTEISRKTRSMLWLYSGDAMLIQHRDGQVQVRQTIPFPGTIVELIVNAPRADNFRLVLDEIYQERFGAGRPPIRFR